jgi:hypothetical protein
MTLENQPVRIFRGEGATGWFITTTEHHVLFSFDVPEDVFALYANGGELSPKAALDLKLDNMSTMQLVLTGEGRFRVVHLSLDQDWISAIQSRQR